MALESLLTAATTRLLLEDVVRLAQLLAAQHRVQSLLDVFGHFCSTVVFYLPDVLLLSLLINNFQQCFLSLNSPEFFKNYSI